MNTWISLQFSVLGGIINISPNRAASGAGDSTITRNATLRSSTAIETLIVIGRRELCLRKSKGGSQGTGLAALRLNNLLLFSFRSDLEYVLAPQQRPSKVWLKAMETFSIQGKLYDMKKSPNNIKTFFCTILPDLSKDLDMANILSTPKKSQRVNFDTARCGDEEVALRICAWCDCQVFKLTLATLGNTSHTCCIWTDFAAVLHSTRFVCQETGFIASKRQNIRGSLVKLSGTTK